MAADCKSALLRVRWFESSPLHQCQLFVRGSYSGNTLAFQAKARSSILLPRSMECDGVARDARVVLMSLLESLGNIAHLAQW